MHFRRETVSYRQKYFNKILKGPCGILRVCDIVVIWEKVDGSPSLLNPARADNRAFSRLKNCLFP